jgi:hypothetical protein
MNVNLPAGAQSLACGTVVLIARAPRKVVKGYLDRNGYKWDKDWELWTNGKDEELRWGVTLNGHYLYIA